ncbi:hypothetical protein LJB78_01290, partial [Bacteroidales bacterium OttesenSCG-928-J16]|nr:hypothetical protein [Bacteroidales bacterium OttesenSCG-928-J16]
SAASYSITVGAGGSNSAIDGGNSIFGSMTANGGSGVADADGDGTGSSEITAGGAGGAASSGGYITASYKGGNGGNGVKSTILGFADRHGGGGGSSAGTGVNGNNGGTGAGNNGATAPAGGGRGGNGGHNGQTSGAAGSAGSAPGGGGGGATNGHQTAGSGANGQVIVTFTIPSQPALISGNNTFCVGETLNLEIIDDNCFTTGTTYTWERGGTTVGYGSSLSLPITSLTQAGVYTVKITTSYSFPGATVSGTSGGFTVSGTTVTGTLTSAGFNVVVYDRPTISNFSVSSVTLCDGETLNITPPSVTTPTGTSITGTGFELETVAGSGVYAGVTLPRTVSMSDNGKRIRYYATNDKCGRRENTPIVVTVRPRVTAANITVSGVTTICTGSSTTLTAAANAAISNPAYTWYDTNGNSIRNTPTFNPGVLTTATTRDTVFYVSVRGDNYCENLPAARKEVRITIQERPTLDIISDRPGICPGVGDYFTLRPDIEGITQVQSYTWYYKDNTGNFVSGGAISPSSGGVTSVNNMTATYAPPITHGVDNNLAVRLVINTGVCGTLTKDLDLSFWSQSIDSDLRIISEPNMPVEPCVEQEYLFRAYANGEGELSQISLTLDDFVGTGITGLEAEYQYIDPITGDDSWQEMDMDDSQLEYFIFTMKIGDDFKLPGGDSISIVVRVKAECGFFAGGDFRFTLGASSGCGDNYTTLDPVSVFTEPYDLNFGTVNDPVYDFVTYLNIAKGENLENDNNDDRVYLADNSIGKVITWTAEISVSDFQPNLSKDSIYFLIPEGIHLVSGSFTSTYPGYASLIGVDPAISYDDIKGFEYMVPFPTGLQLPEVFSFSIDFTLEGTPCDYYDFYMEIIHQDELQCASEGPCTFYRTEAPSYFGMEVQWYEYEIPEDQGIIGHVDADQWTGQYTIKAVTEYFANTPGSTLEVYVDRNNNGIIDRDANGDPTEPKIYSVSRTIENDTPSGTPYNVIISNPIDAEPGKQLLM